MLAEDVTGLFEQSSCLRAELVLSLRFVLHQNGTSRAHEVMQRQQLGSETLAPSLDFD